MWITTELWIKGPGCVPGHFITVSFTSIKTWLLVNILKNLLNEYWTNKEHKAT